MDGDTKRTFIVLGLLILVAVGGTLIFGFLMSTSIKSERNERSPQVHAECEAKGGKIMITYNSSYAIEKVTCVPAGVNLIERK